MNNNSINQIGFYDIWQILSKYKCTFWLVFIVVLVFGIVMALSKPKYYQYTQAIKVASYLDKGRITPLASLDGIIANIYAIYLPLVLHSYNTEHKNQQVFWDENSLAINKSGEAIIILSAKGTLQQQAVYAELFQALLAQLNTDTTPLVQARKNFFINNLAILQHEFESQNALDKTATKQLAAQDYVLKNVIASIQRKMIMESADDVAELKEGLNSLQNSSFSSTLIRSVTPVDASRSVLMVLSAMVAVFVGFLAVFVRDFWVKLKNSEKK